MLDNVGLYFLIECDLFDDADRHCRSVLGMAAGFRSNKLWSPVFFGREICEMGAQFATWLLIITTWWLIPLSKWVITPVINGISRVNPIKKLVV